MPKNKGKGGKNRRRGKNEGEEKRELVFKEHGQEYAQVGRERPAGKRRRAPSTSFLSNSLEAPRARLTGGGGFRCCACWATGAWRRSAWTA
jgi:hypothetical protein